MAEPEREELTWQELGEGTRTLAEMVHASGYEPDVILAIARGGLLVAGAMGYALGRQERLHGQRRVLHRARTSASSCRSCCRRCPTRASSRSAAC